MLSCITAPKLNVPTAKMVLEPTRGTVLLASHIATYLSATRDNNSRNSNKGKILKAIIGFS
jgi:hypothetical protein